MLGAGGKNIKKTGRPWPSWNLRSSMCHGSPKTKTERSFVSATMDIGCQELEGALPLIRGVRGLNHVPQNSCVEALTPNISECDCIWREGL